VPNDNPQTTRPPRDRGDKQPGLVRMQAVLTRADARALRDWITDRQKDLLPHPAGPMNHINWQRLRHG
jgi:hypothetical protein